MGIKPIYNLLHVQDLMGDVDVILNSNGLNVENPIDVNVYKKENINLEIPIQCKYTNIQLELYLHGRPSCSNTLLTTPKPFMEVVNKPLHGNPMHTSTNIPINTHT
jgi:hypothetical protein